MQQEVRRGRSQIIEDSDGNVRDGTDVGKHGWAPDGGNEATQSYRIRFQLQETGRYWGEILPLAMSLGREETAQVAQDKCLSCPTLLRRLATPFVG